MIDDIIKRFDKQFPNLYTGGSFIANGLVKSFIRTEYEKLVKEIVDEIPDEIAQRYVDGAECRRWWSIVKII